PAWSLTPSLHDALPILGLGRAALGLRLERPADRAEHLQRSARAFAADGSGAYGAHRCNVGGCAALGAGRLSGMARGELCAGVRRDRKSTRLNSSHVKIS